MPAAAMEIAAARGLSPDDINAALKTYVPSGKMDDYYLFSSGGQSGNVVVIGVPSMRLPFHMPKSRLPTSVAFTTTPAIVPLGDSVPIQPAG